MFTTAPRALSTAARNSSRYFASVEPKCLFQGSILRTLNFSPQCAAKSFRSIFWAAASSCAPNMKSRNGYDAMATRSRASVGNFTWGPASTENASRGYSDAVTAANADCTRNPLRVLCDKVGTVYQIHPNPEQGRPCSGLLSPARVRRIVNWSIRRMAACCDPESPSEVNQRPHCAVPVGQKSKIQQRAKKEGTSNGRTRTKLGKRLGRNKRASRTKSRPDKRDGGGSGEKSRRQD